MRKCQAHGDGYVLQKSKLHLKARILLLETNSISSVLLSDRFFSYPSLSNHGLSVNLSSKNGVS